MRHLDVTFFSCVLALVNVCVVSIPLTYQQKQVSQCELFINKYCFIKDLFIPCLSLLLDIISSTKEDITLPEGNLNNSGNMKSIVNASRS